MSGLRLADLGERVRATLEELVGCSVEGLSDMHRVEDGWKLCVDVLELARVPSTTDVLASYEVTVDEEGEVTGFRRVRRFLRSQVEG